MNMKEIKEKWFYKEINLQASVEMWDSMAPDFSQFEMPTEENSSLMKLITEKGMIDKESIVLDVGCGAGKYSLALAEKCLHVVGLDLSPKMIEKALEKKEKMKVDNVEFHINNWHEFDLSNSDYKGKFDLVIANMTPAVRSADTFLKIHEASKKHCVLTKPVKRYDPISDAIREMLHLEEKRESFDKDILYAFEILWLLGSMSEIQYESQIWDKKMTINTAYKLYANRMKSYRALTEEEDKEIMNYLQSISNDGIIEEKVDTTIAAIYWQVQI